MHTIHRLAVVGLLCLWAAASVAAEEQGSPEQSRPVDIGSRRELFVDHVLIDRLDNVQLKLHEPVSGGVAIQIDKPWEGVTFGGSVLHHRGRYMLYYSASPVEDDVVALCVATSEDGVTWTKPVLGLVPYAGSRDNNVVASSVTANFDYASAPWVDDRPGVPDDEKIKATTSEALSGEKHTSWRDPTGPKRLVFWASPDGLTFRKLEPQPEFVTDLPNSFDGGNTVFWSEAEQQYVLCYRFWDVVAKAASADVTRLGGRGYRSMARTTSKDLMTWTKPVPMTYGDTTREQFYVNNTQPYFRAPHISVALAARFMEGRRVLTDEQVQRAGFLSSHGSTYFGDCSDGVLLTSRAGTTHYDRTFMEAFVRPGLGYGNWGSRTNFPLTGLLPCGPDRMMFWVARHYMQKSWYIERMMLRTDGFASVHAPWRGGEMLTKPLTFTGKRLDINYATSAAGGIRVEVQGEDGKPIPGYALDDCLEIIGDEITRTVAWKNGENLSSLAGRPVRLRFVMHDADLYSIRFEEF